MAGVACFRVRVGGGAFTLARLTGDSGFKVNSFFYTEHGIAQADGDVNKRILALAHAGGRPALLTAGEHVKEVLETEPGTTKPAESGAPEPSSASLLVASCIVDTAFLGV